MSRLFFVLLTLLSVIGLILGLALLSNAHMDKSIGMIAIFIMPLLAFGLLLGGAAYWIKTANEINPSGILGYLYKFNLGMMILGAIGLIYGFIN